MFDRIPVVDRGEPALRLVRARRELDAEHGTRTRGALHTEAERRATVVRAAQPRPRLIAAVQRGTERAGGT